MRRPRRMPWWKGGTLMASAIDRIAVRVIAGVAASAVCDGSKVGVPARMATDTEPSDEDARGAIMMCRSSTGSAVPVRTARWRA
jgi:hypothetical protein